MNSLQALQATTKREQRCCLPLWRCSARTRKTRSAKTKERRVWEVRVGWTKIAIYEDKKKNPVPKMAISLFSNKSFAWLIMKYAHFASDWYWNRDNIWFPHFYPGLQTKIKARRCLVTRETTNKGPNSSNSASQEPDHDDAQLVAQEGELSRGRNGCLNTHHSEAPESLARDKECNMIIQGTEFIN